RRQDPHGRGEPGADRRPSSLGRATGGGRRGGGVVRALVNAVRIALRAIARSKLRAALTVLGILIGVAAVVIVVALGTGTRDVITGKFASLGANIIFIWPQATQSSGAKQVNLGRMTEADGEAIARDAQSVAAV